MLPTVSLVIPTYNRADKLQTALRSALQQTYPSVEVIVLDDASSDSSPGRVQELATRGVRYIRNPDNRGPNANWRAGMAAAEGAFFGFLADDDVLEPTYVEQLVAPLIEDEDAILAFSDHWIIDSQGEKQPQLTVQNATDYGRAELEAGRVDDLARTALIDESIYIGAVLFRRSDVPPHFLAPEARSAMGGWILYQCVKSRKEGYYIPDRLMRCRWQDGSVSRSQRWIDSMTEGNINRLRLMLDDPMLQRFQSRLEYQLSVHLATRGRFQLANGNRGVARPLLKEAFQHCPSFQGAATYLLASLGILGTGIARGFRWLSGNG